MRNEDREAPHKKLFSGIFSLPTPWIHIPLSNTLSWWELRIRSLNVCITLVLPNRTLAMSPKSKVHLITGHGNQNWEYMYSCTPSLTSALDGLRCQGHAPAALPPGKCRYTLYRRLDKPQGRSGLVRKISPPTGIRSSESPARSKSLYRLSYRGPLLCLHKATVAS